MNNKFYYITIATKPHPILLKILNRINKQNETLIVLGEHENRYIGWQSTGNFGVKLKEVYNFLFNSTLNDNDIILFTDAYDVVYNGDFNEIQKRFATFDKPIIFGCEKLCNPDPKQIHNYKDINHEFPFLNSGLFIGRVWALRKCMEKYKYNDKHDDQLYWTIQFFNSGLIQLDYENNLFLNTADINILDIKLDGKNIIYKNKNPLFIHINGPDKTELSYFSNI